MNMKKKSHHITSVVTLIFLSYLWIGLFNKFIAYQESDISYYFNLLILILLGIIIILLLFFGVKNLIIYFKNANR